MPTEERERSLKAAVVKIFDTGRTPIGTGFLVRWDLVATCAHVIKKVFRGTTHAERPHGKSIEVQFSGGPDGSFLQAEVVPAYFKENEDVALLRLSEAAPAAVEPLALATSSGLTGQILRGFGFADPGGLWMAATVAGPLDADKRWQLSSTNISPGCSGGPLWNDAGYVVAMASSIRDPDPITGRHHDTCYGRASEVLMEVCPGLTHLSSVTRSGRTADTTGHINWLEWPMNRRQQPFRAYVVEPAAYKPSTHAAVFRASLGRLGISLLTEIKAGSPPLPTERFIEPFDLVTFPEAFLPAAALVHFLKDLGRSPMPMGCIHTGLSATAEDEHTHLFRRDQLRDLVTRLQALPAVVDQDFEPMRRWLSDPEKERGMFNAGCFFMVDADRRLRICLHLKNVASNYETSPLLDKNMKEACLFSLVTLRPSDRRMTSIVVQPLICSDVIERTTNVPGAHPITVLTSGAAALDRCPPDHVDIVSVATCTPQALVPERVSDIDVHQQSKKRSKWKDKFCNSYERAVRSDEWRRHRYAAFVLANYRVFPDASSGNSGKIAPPLAGLSGVFLPTPLKPKPCDAFVLVDVFARTDEKFEKEEEWMSAKVFTERKGGHVLGHLMALDPSTAYATATALGFTITQLPRDANRWDRTGEIVDVEQIDIRVDL
ncbi:serine protease [Sorangium sp. So ce367]|uniref:S1 family peptidase n=1 Tax=Sorangium sp. So ce367 TaxID=3133305 RepID=UPI003F5EF845